MDSNEDIKLKIANKLIELKENVENSKEKEENKKILEDFLKILPEIKENMVNLSEKEIFENLRKKNTVEIIYSGKMFRIATGLKYFENIGLNING